MIAPLGNSSAGLQGQLLNQYRRNNDFVGQSLERLSTGLRINHGYDDPAGLIAAEDIRGDLLELSAESLATEYERFQLRRRDSALSQISSILGDVRGNLVSAADGFNSPEQTAALQLEIDASLDAIDRIADNTDGVADSTDLIELRSGGDANVVDGDVAAAAELVGAKISDITSARAAIGAYERGELEPLQRLREDQIVINARTLSTIEDADYATESANLVQGKILAKVTLAAFAISNETKGTLLNALIGGINR